MDSLTDVLNKHFFPYAEKVVTFDGALTVLDNTNRQLGSNFPQKGKDIINRVSKPIRNDHIVFLYCYSGELDCRVNMIEYHLQRDDMLFVSENAIVEIGINDYNVKLIALVIGPGYYPPDVGIKDYLSFHEMIVQQPFVHLNGILSAHIVNTCRQIDEIISGRHGAYASELAKTYLKAFYLYCAMALNESRQTYVTSRSPHKMMVLKRFFDLVEQYFATERQISFYAGKLCLAPKYASQVIRQASGKMAGDWIQERVILEAKLLLLDGHHNVQQVADALNFSSQSFFGKYFKSATGMSPKEYVVKNR